MNRSAQKLDLPGVKLVHRNEGLLLLGKGMSKPPCRAWERDRSPSGTTYHREPKRAEAYRLMTRGQLPNDITGARWTNPEIADEIRVPGALFDPVAELRLDESSDRIWARFGLKETDGSILPPPRDFGGALRRGYAVCEGVFVPFDPELLRFTRQALEEAGVSATRPHGSPLTYRDYRRLKIRLAEAGVKVLDFVDEEAYLDRLRRDWEKREPLPVPPLSIELYPYQKEALDWLRFCHENELGCLLADDMGLGKTATVISFLASVRDQRPNLVVCPATLLENWSREFRKFCPDLPIFIHHGRLRLSPERPLQPGVTVITSYGLFRNDRRFLQRVSWNVVALDEAGEIKNPESGVGRACREYRASCKVAMTGTPFENHPLDLWSLLEFVEPGYLGDRETFMNAYGRGIEDGSSAAAKELENRVKLLSMRRMKSDVREDLPEKIEIDQPVSMPHGERLLHEEAIEQALLRHDLEGSHPNLVTPLRQLCCHPSLLAPENDSDPTLRCAKYRKLVYLLGQIAERDEKALVFASFVRMLDIFEEDLPKRLGVSIHRIDGGVPAHRRQGVIDSFTAERGSAVMILNPRAAGVGLNLVAANHVVHYSREWNPAREDQATDRAYRIGQTKDVLVHYLRYENSIEQVMADRLQRKRGVSEELVRVSEDKNSQRETLLEALELLPEPDRANRI
jgi:SNF2 family DNA or RNA helicase